MRGRLAQRQPRRDLGLIGLLFAGRRVVADDGTATGGPLFVAIDLLALLVALLRLDRERGDGTRFQPL